MKSHNQTATLNWGEDWGRFREHVYQIFSYGSPLSPLTRRLQPGLASTSLSTLYRIIVLVFSSLPGHRGPLKGTLILINGCQLCVNCPCWWLVGVWARMQKRDGCRVTACRILQHSRALGSSDCHTHSRHPPDPREWLDNGAWTSSLSHRQFHQLTRTDQHQ